MTTNIKSARQILEQLYLNRNETGDVTFMVETEPIRAHRWVLAAASPKFKAQFYGMCPDEGTIHISNVSAAAFSEFLQFFYRETVDLTIEHIEAVMNLAKQSLCDEFVDNCISFLVNITTSKNICWMYLFAIMYEIDALRLECERIISNETQTIFESDEFLSCSREMLLRILKSDMLDCFETDVFNACITWARSNCKQNGLDDENIENLRAALGDAIYQIRFSSMRAKEFATLHKSLSGFFTPDEIIDILYISSHLEGFESKQFNQKPRVRPYHKTDDSYDSDEDSERSVDLDEIDEWR